MVSSPATWSRDFDVDQRKRLFDAVSDVFVGLGGLGPSGGVDVGQDDFGGVVFEGFLDDFAGMDGGAVDGSSKEVLRGDEAAVVPEGECRQHAKTPIL
jgi:hypothetical protein